MLRALAGDVHTLRRMLESFLTGFESSFVEWENALKEGDGNRLFELQHRWLSGFRTLGYEELSQRIAEIQNELRHNPNKLTEVEKVRQDLADFQVDLQHEIGLLNLHLNK